MKKLTSFSLKTCLGFLLRAARYLIGIALILCASLLWLTWFSISALQAGLDFLGRMLVYPAVILMAVLTSLWHLDGTDRSGDEPKS
jgi:hypothetical protein